MSIDGVWNIPYSPAAEGDDGSDLHDDPAGAAVLTLNGGRITGSDPDGRAYSGGYELAAGGAFRAEISVTPDQKDAAAPYGEFGVRFPVTVTIDAEYRGADRMPFRGSMNGKLPITGTAKRIP